MKAQAAVAFKFLMVMTILTGIAYPILMTGLARTIFPLKAEGSLIIKDGRLLGSKLIGQSFDSSAYFSSRPSATGYNPVPSSGSNLGPTSDKLKKQSMERSRYFATMNTIPDPSIIPAEMIFASGSGLDPHISPEAAMLQAERVISSRGFTEEQRQMVFKLIDRKIEERQFFILGERRINVFELNLELDNIR